MATFSKYEPKSEKELHEIIEKEIDELEKGLIVLKYEFVYGKGTPDFLCVDSGKRLTIIEVKLHEDENILFQALRYYSDIDAYRYILSSLFPERIDPKQSTRIILIAENFSDDLKKLSTLVKPDLELYEYSVLTTKNNEKGIIFHSILLPEIIDPIIKVPSINDLLLYITDEGLRDKVQIIRGEIKAIGNEVVEYPTQSYIGYRFKGRSIAALVIHRKLFDITASIIDENTQSQNNESIRIETPSDNYSEIIEKIKRSFKNLGGKLNE